MSCGRASDLFWACRLSGSTGDKQVFQLAGNAPGTVRDVGEPTTTRAVRPLTPLAIANWVSMSLAILCRRSASPNAADHGSRPLRSTRITPENPDATASSVTRLTTSAMIKRLIRAAEGRPTAQAAREMSG